LRKVESSTLNERGEEKATEALHPKCRSERKKDTRLEESGELNVERTWRGKGKRSTSSQM
jgi:hypothetical protein